MRGLCDTDHPFIRSPRGLMIFTPVEEQGVGTVISFTSRPGFKCLTFHNRGEPLTNFAAACITNTYSLNRTFPARMPILHVTPPTPLTPPKPDEDLGFIIKWSRVFFKLHWKLIILCVNLHRMKYTKVKIFVKHLLCNLSDLISWLFVIYLCLRLNNCKCSKLIIACVIFICK